MRRETTHILKGVTELDNRHGIERPISVDLHASVFGIIYTTLDQEKIRAVLHRKKSVAGDTNCCMFEVLDRRTCSSLKLRVTVDKPLSVEKMLAWSTLLSSTVLTFTIMSSSISLLPRM